MIDRIAGFISRNSMFGAGARVGVAVSGGADSVCLLHILLELRPRWDLQLQVIHVNHLLRSRDSDEDEQFVAGIARSLGLPLILERIDVAALASAEGANLEQTAREARRAVFYREIEAGRLDRVAVAHTRSDQAETVLFHLLRGAYTSGLAGMRPAGGNGIVRPLLDTDRAEVEGFLRDRGISWREDATNADPSFSRNRIRHHWLPALAAEWNPNLAAQFARHAFLAQEDEQYWEAEVDRHAPGVFEVAGRVVLADVSHFEELPPAMARRLIRRAIQSAKGDLLRIDFEHIDRVLRLMRGPSRHARLQIPGLDVLRSFDLVRFARLRADEVPDSFILPVAVPGVVELPRGEGSVALEIVERQAGTESANAILKTGLDWNHVQGALSAGDNATGKSLVMRNWRPGDAYRRAGDRQERKIKALFQAARVPLWERRKWPVLCVEERILWSRRFGPAADAAPNSATKLVLRITERQ